MSQVSSAGAQLPEVPPHLVEEGRFKLVDGEWVEAKMGAKASQVNLIIGGLLYQYVAKHGGAAFDSECGYKIFPHAPKLVRYPDVSFVRPGRLTNDEGPDGHMLIVPDLAVESVSPNDLAEEVEVRVMDFMQVKVPMMWVVYPKTRCIRVLRPEGACLQLTEADELRGEDVLPGFTCRVGSLFSKK